MIACRIKKNIRIYTYGRQKKSLLLFFQIQIWNFEQSRERFKIKTVHITVKVRCQTPASTRYVCVCTLVPLAAVDEVLAAVCEEVLLLLRGAVLVDSCGAAALARVDV